MRDRLAGTPRRRGGPLFRRLPPGPGRRREEVRAHQRARLIAATIELAAERGYRRTTVEDIAGLAGVSKASFYEQFSGKPECFLASSDAVLRAAARAVLTGESTAGGGRERLRAGLASLADLIVEQPKGAKLVLLEGPAAPPQIRNHIRRRFGLLEALVRDRLEATPSGGDLPRALTTGIVRGIAHHATRCVRADSPEKFRDLVDPLLDWGLSFDAERVLTSFGTLAPPPVGSCLEIDDSLPSADVDTRDLLMAAAIRLAARDGFDALTPARIRRAAGVPRRDFDACFEDATSCFLAAAEEQIQAVVPTNPDPAAQELPWTVTVCRLLDRVTAALADYPTLAKVIFVESANAAPRSFPWRERVIATWAERIYEPAPRRTRPPPVVAEATVAAIWGFIADLVAAGKLSALPATRTRLACFALTPVLGASRASLAIEATVRRRQFANL